MFRVYFLTFVFLNFAQVQAGPQLELQCSEKEAKKDSLTLKIRLNQFPSEEQRSVVELQTPVRDENDKVQFFYSIESFLSISLPEKIVDDAGKSTDTFYFQKMGGMPLVRLTLNEDYSAASARLLKIVEGKVNVHTYSCEIKKANKVLVHDALELYLSEIEYVARNGNVYPACKMFVDYMKVQKLILENEKDEMRWNTKRNIEGSGRRNEKLIPFCEKVIKEEGSFFYDHKTIAEEVLAKLESIRTPYGWE